MQELDKIMEEIDNRVHFYDNADDPMMYVETVKDIIRKHMNDGWIPIENPPEDGQTVLCTDGEYVYLVEYNADLDAPFGDMDNINYWKPSPATYRPERGEEE